jgi:hypothetical protein
MYFTKTTNHIPIEYASFMEGKYFLGEKSMGLMKKEYAQFKDYKIASFEDFKIIHKLMFGEKPSIQEINEKYSQFDKNLISEIYYETEKISTADNINNRIVEIYSTLSQKYSNATFPQKIVSEIYNALSLFSEIENKKDVFDESFVELKPEVEKMSKSKLNVVTPDDLIEKYGADTLRLYEMFLGPLEQHKPWDTQGIEGVFRFIRKLWKLYHDFDNNLNISDEAPSKEELKALHKTIKKIQEDIERFSFNTAVSAFMICVNELTELKCNKRVILSDLAIIISPYAPHIAEELWSLLGNKESISTAAFPIFNEAYLVENTCTYAVSFNGKMRFTIALPVDMPKEEVEKNALEHKDAAKWLEGKKPKKVIVVPKKIVNIVV